jgi:hypothetical protein
LQQLFKRRYVRRDSPIVAHIAPKSCHISVLGVKAMLQTYTNTRPYGQPLSPIPVSGERYALPPGFVDGLVFLRPLLPRKGNWFDTQVNVLGGKLYLLTNQLVVDYDVGRLDLPNWWFGPDVIRVLEAFGAPTEVFIQGDDLCFRWLDGQELFARPSSNLLPSDFHQRMADETFNHFHPFDQGTEITDDTRRDLRKLIDHKKLATDIFINGQSIASRMSSYGKSWTLENSDPFPTNATRIMRFDRQAFLNMIRVADEIDFSVSPVCFRHAHGKGLLIERTATLDTPDMGPFDE